MKKKCLLCKYDTCWRRVLTTSHFPRYVQKYCETRLMHYVKSNNGLSIDSTMYTQWTVEDTLFFCIKNTWLESIVHPRHKGVRGWQWSQRIPNLYQKHENLWQTRVDRLVVCYTHSKHTPRHTYNTHLCTLFFFLLSLFSLFYAWCYFFLSLVALSTYDSVDWGEPAITIFALEPRHAHLSPFYHQDLLIIPACTQL